MAHPPRTPSRSRRRRAPPRSRRFHSAFVGTSASAVVIVLDPAKEELLVAVALALRIIRRRGDGEV